MSACTLPHDNECALPAHCPCEHRGDALVRGTLVSLDAESAVVSVEDVLRAPLHDASAFDVEEGDRVGGRVLAPMCGDGEVTLATGAQVLGFYTRGTLDRIEGCAEYVACVSGCQACAAACASDTAEVCASHRAQALLDGRIALVAWTEPLYFGTADDGSAIVLPQHLLTAFDDADACESAMPTGRPVEPVGGCVESE